MKVVVEVAGGAPVEFDDARLAEHRAALELGPQPPPVRLAYAAAHVVFRPELALVADDDPAAAAEHIDWDATAAVRRRLASRGFAIAEAMDTAQRFELGWAVAARLIDACGALRLPHGFVAGASADHVTQVAGMAALVDGVVEQAAHIRQAGGEVILLPQPWLTQHGCGADDYVAFYRAVLDQLEGPVYLHWLGAMFQPALAGYFPGDSFDQVMALRPDVLRGAKLSLLDAAHERSVRMALLARDQIVLTGDDFHFAGLIAGADHGEPLPAVERHVHIGAREVPVGAFSHALLGVLDAVAEPAALALRALARGDAERYFALMAPAEALGQAVFEPPTRHYKAGLAFLAWLDGAQENFLLAAGEHRARSVEHYVRVARLAAAAGVISDAGTAAARLRMLLGT